MRSGADNHSNAPAYDHQAPLARQQSFGSLTNASQQSHVTSENFNAAFASSMTIELLVPPTIIKEKLISVIDATG